MMLSALSMVSFCGTLMNTETMIYVLFVAYRLKMVPGLQEKIQKTIFESKTILVEKATKIIWADIHEEKPVNQPFNKSRVLESSPKKMASTCIIGQTGEIAGKVL